MQFCLTISILIVRKYCCLNVDLTSPSSPPSARSSSHFTATSCDPHAAMAPDNIVRPADPGHAATITSPEEIVSESREAVHNCRTKEGFLVLILHPDPGGIYSVWFKVIKMKWFICDTANVLSCALLCDDLHKHNFSLIACRCPVNVVQ